MTASVWHRPVVSEEVKDRLAERQARAAVALVRMGKAEDVWPLLRHSADPRLRSFIVNWLNPLGADPRLIAAELDRIDPNAKPTPAPGQQKMDSILFHPETSHASGVDPGIGDVRDGGTIPGEREPLIGKLLDFYRNDPDAGIHGAAEWTLRQVGAARKAERGGCPVDEGQRLGRTAMVREQSGSNVRCDRRSGRVPHGLAGDRAGSYAPIESPQADANPPPFRHRRQGGHYRAIPAVRENNPNSVVPPSVLNRYSPDPGGPTIVGPWYGAAAYCNWLSEQEGLPKEQWCYLPNEAEAYAEGMLIPADILQRTGYRLPTEAEWEYACRAGTVTSRYYGHSIDLLDAHAWYQANSKDHARTCGSLISNDLGLFDMLGNMYEWCQDKENGVKVGKIGPYDDLINVSESIVDKNPRLLRGGAFGNQPADVRSALRYWNAPSNRISGYGFRPARSNP